MPVATPIKNKNIGPTLSYASKTQTMATTGEKAQMIFLLIVIEFLFELFIVF